MADRGREFIYHPGEVGTSSGLDEPPVLPPWVTRSPREYPPQGSIRFNRTAWADFAVPGSSSPAGLTFRAPKGFAGILDTIALYANDMVATSDISWRVTVNGASLEGYEAATMFPRVAGFSYVGDGDLGIDLVERAQIIVTITKGDVAVQKVGANLTGWFYPLRYVKGF